MKGICLNDPRTAACRAAIAFLLAITAMMSAQAVLSSCFSPSTSALANCAARICRSSGPGSSDQAGDEWPMFRGALDHAGSVTTTPVQGTGPTWSHTTGNSVSSSPAVAGGCVYIGSDDSNLYCLNATTGAQVWHYTTTTTAGYPVVSSPAVAGGFVYVGSYDDNVYCLNTTTGTQVWHYTMGSGTASSPAVAGGCVYVGSGDHKVYCLNAATGVFVWSYTTGISVWYSSPAVAGGRVYIGSDDGKVYCLSMILPSNNLVKMVPIEIAGAAGIVSTAIVIGWIVKRKRNHRPVESERPRETILRLEKEITKMWMVPSAPRYLRTRIDAGRVVLSWQKPASTFGSAITGYKVYRGVSPGDEALIATLGNVTMFTDAGAAIGQDSYYKVSAVNYPGEGALSDGVALNQPEPGPESEALESD